MEIKKQCRASCCFLLCRHWPAPFYYPSMEEQIPKKEKWSSSPKTGIILSALQSDAMIAQHLHNNSIFVSIANEKHICVSLQGQGTRPRWRVVKIDTKHKLSAPLKDLEAPMCRWVLAFELSPRFTKKIPSAVSTSWVKRWFMWFLSFFHRPLAVISVT